MNVQVKLFAVARELAGRDVVEVSLDEPATVGQLRDALARQIPALAPVLPRVMVAVNEEYAGDRDPVPAGATVACIPPVSGG